MPECDEYIWGLDFGFNNPTALIRVGLRDGEIYLDEQLYASHLTNSELIGRMESLGVPKKELIYCDAEDTNRIEEIFRNGWNAYPADKGPGSVKRGVDLLKSKMVHITKASTNLIRDWKAYSWKTNKNGEIIDEPVKFNDHGCDAARYAVYSHSLSNVRVEIF